MVHQLCHVTFGPRGLSDHSLTLLDTGVQLLLPRKQFQFFNHMVLLDGFKDSVKNVWTPFIIGNPFYVFSEKLKHTRATLISLNHTTGNLSTLVRITKEDLHSVQNLLHAHPMDLNLLAREKTCHHQLWTAIEREESLLQQKSRATWLALGDRNSRFFANMMKNRRNSNKILSILN